MKRISKVIVSNPKDSQLDNFRERLHQEDTRDKEAVTCSSPRSGGRGSRVHHEVVIVRVTDNLPAPGLQLLLRLGALVVRVNWAGLLLGGRSLLDGRLLDPFTYRTFIRPRLIPL